MSPYFELVPASDADSDADNDVEMVRLAFELADGAARSDVEVLCEAMGYGTGCIMNTHVFVGRDIDRADEQKTLARALRYLDLRGNDTFGFAFIREPGNPHLVRFKAKP